MGRRPDRLTPLDLLRAAFRGCRMTPLRAAVQVLQHIEPYDDGLFWAHVLVPKCLLPAVARPAGGSRRSRIVAAASLSHLLVWKANRGYGEPFRRFPFCDPESLSGEPLRWATTP